MTTKTSTFLTLYFCNVYSYHPSADSLESLPKAKSRFEQEKRANHARPLATSKDRKNRGLSADLSSYHDGAFPGSRVQDPLSQTQ